MNEQNFYPNLDYNRQNRKKFFTLIILLIACMGVVVGLMVTIQQYLFAAVFGFIIIMTLFLIPSAIKNHPVKSDVPVLSVQNKTFSVSGKTYNVSDIDMISVTVLLNPVSKIKDENLKYLQETAKKFPEEKMLGNVDVRLKKGVAKKGEEVLYTTLEDCLGACVALVGAGAKHYSIYFNIKKLNEKAQFSITKVETQKQKITLSEVSAKDRLKQLL